MKENENKSIGAIIIDDDVDICFLLTLVLKNKNIQSVFVNSLTEAKNIFSKYNPSVIFLDNHLPDGVGIDFIPFIKKMYPETKVLMITAHNSETNKKRAVESGAEYFIGKPFNMEEISNVLDVALNNHK
ncbi:MAG TPA: response regulator [Bacteroidales bacterium]|nr:response regulator [Bacteroidales bacterium]